MKKLKLDSRSLSAQMIFSFVALVILTAAAAGLPALWLVRGELERQAWRQLEQGTQAAEALYAARQSELAALAALTAERPTLKTLLAGGDPTALAEYLAALQSSAGLDLLLVCRADGQPLAGGGEPGACKWPPNFETAEPAFYTVAPGPPPVAWLAAAQSVAQPPALQGGPLQILAGLRLDEEFAAEMRAQTGLEQGLLASGEPLVGSLHKATERRPVTSPAAMGTAGVGRESLTLAGEPYYAQRISLGPGLAAEVALPVANLAATQRRLGWTVAASVAAVAAVGSLLGAVLAGRIGRPLAGLVEAAGALSRGELDRPLDVEAHVREVTLLAQALEGARADLYRSLAELRQEKAWTDHLLEAIVEGIVTLDRQGHITFFSQGAERITGLGREQVLGRGCDQIFCPVGSVEPFSRLIPAPGGRRKIAVELRDGRQAMLAVTGARLLPPEGGQARVALVFRDVSEEEAIHRLLGDFIANVAHEFRTPLSAVAASVELLLDQAPDLSPAELQELLTSLHLGIVGLQTLVDNLLESASIETGHFRVNARPSSLADIIGDAVRTMQPLLDKHNQPLVVDLPAAIPVVRADPRRTAQALVNLLSNAAKYGLDGTDVEIGATVTDGRVRVTVADQGPGIAAEDRRALFRRFARPGADGDPAHMGAGLGLWVVKAVVEAQGGQVGLDDRPGGGMIFWFTLPLAGEP